MITCFLIKFSNLRYCSSNGIVVFLKDFSLMMYAMMRAYYDNALKRIYFTYNAPFEYSTFSKITSEIEKNSILNPIIWLDKFRDIPFDSVFTFIEMVFNADLFPILYLSFPIQDLEAFIEIFQKQENTWVITPVIKLHTPEDFAAFEKQYPLIFRNQIYHYEFGVTSEILNHINKVSEIVPPKELNNFQAFLTFLEKIEDLKNFLRTMRKLNFPLYLKNTIQYAPVLTNVQPTPCPAMRDEIGIDAFGNIYPCRNGYLANAIIGNLQNAALQSLLNKKETNNSCINCEKNENCSHCLIPYPYPQSEFCQLMRGDKE